MHGIRLNSTDAPLKLESSRLLCMSDAAPNLVVSKYSHCILPFREMEMKKYYPKQESIPCHSLSRRVCLLALEANRIEPVPLAFKTSGISNAPLVLHYTSRVSRIWPGSCMRINSLYLSKHGMFTHERGNPCILCMPALRLRDMIHMKSNKLEIRLDKTDQ